MKSAMSRIPATRSAVRIVLAAALLAGAIGVLGTRTAVAGPVGINGYGGWYDGETLMLGGGALIGLAGITVNPNFEYYFVDSGTAYSLNVDGTMTVIPAAVASGWLGAGMGFATVDPEVGNKNTETVFNLLAGAGLNAIPLKPYIQFKYVVQDGDDPVVVSIGARF